MANGAETVIPAPGILEPAPPTLKRRAAEGAAWLMAQSLGAKAISFIGQIIVARILDERAFGFVGLAYIVPTFVGLVQQGGLREILLRRQKRLHLWENAAFWLSVLQGLVSMGAMLLLAPLVNRFFANPGDPAGDSTVLGHLILILAAQSLIGALGMVPETRLHIDLRFRFLAFLGTFQAVATIGATIVLALLGFGAYSYILPIPVVGLIRAAVVWVAAPVRVRPRLEFRKWLYMITDSWVIFVTSVCYVLTWQADYVIVGRLYPKEVVGAYYWAFNLSTQTMTLLVLNMSGVMLSTLAKLTGDRERQRAAFIRSAKITSAFAVPVCLAQAALADAGVRLVFTPNWWDSIALVQVLSIAGAFQSATFLAYADFKAAGRFKEMMWLMVGFAVFFAGVVYVGALLGAALGAAIGVCLFHAVTGPLVLWVALSPGEQRIGHMARIILRPILLGALAGAAAVTVDRLLARQSATTFVLIARLGAAGTTFAAVYLGLLPLIAPDLWKEAAPVRRRLAKRLPWSRTPGPGGEVGRRMV